MIDLTPCPARNIAAAAPPGPPPTISTSVFITTKKYSHYAGWTGSGFVLQSSSRVTRGGSCRKQLPPQERKVCLLQIIDSVQGPAYAGIYRRFCKANLSRARCQC